MKYLLLIYTDEKVWAPEVSREKCIVEATQLTHELHAKGQYLGASPLQPVATARSVRVRDGKRLVTDGPFAETHEQLGGYFLIEARDLDKAVGVAARIPSAPQRARWEVPAGRGPDGTAGNETLAAHEITKRQSGAASMPHTGVLDARVCLMHGRLTPRGARYLFSFASSKRFLHSLEVLP